MTPTRRPREGLVAQTFLGVWILLTVVLASCGGDSLSMTEYSQRLDTLAEDLAGALEAGDVRMSTGTPSLEDARTVLNQAVLARTEFQEAFSALEPPEQIADLHADLFDAHARIITAQQAFSDRATTATAVEELDQSAEAQAYRRTVDESLALCQEFQARIDATADLNFVIDTPWISIGQEVVHVAFGC